MKRIKILYVLLTVILTAGFVLSGVFVFGNSYLRFIEAVKDLYTSVVFYISFLINVRTKVVPTVTEYSEVLTWHGYLPDSTERIREFLGVFFNTFFNADNFSLWIKDVLHGTGTVIAVIAFLLPVFLLVVFLMKRLYGKVNNDYGKDTVPLKVFKAAIKVSVLPVYNFICGYIRFLIEKRWIVRCWVLLWALNLNVLSLVVEGLAYFFYLIASFDLTGVFKQIAKLVIDLQVAVRTIPVVVWIILGVWLWDKGRRKIALKRLRHFEARNCGFIKELPIATLSCGSMGKKKTTLITDMALSQDVMFRQKALAIITKKDVLFPHFPWICFENEIKRCMEYGVIYNLASVKKWIKKKRERFYRHGDTDRQLYGYETERFGTVYNDGLKERDIFDVLETYALAYFIYVTESSLIASNYSIRTDNAIISEGNFPLWVLDFFGNGERGSRRSHILDFDTLRLGRKVIEENKNRVFEFGVIAITEIGKERGNNLELKDIKKDAKETNQKNDLFNSWLKMCRHSATVDNFPFIKVFCDEQRPESWGADARDLADVVTIEKSGEKRLALPFYTIEEMITEKVFDKFTSFYYNLRFLRGDNTLLTYLIKAVASALFKRNERIYNRYGYSVLSLLKERGTMDGKKERKKYFLMDYKVYRDRFTTDCFSDYFDDLGVKGKKGLKDYMEYREGRASVEELKMQNSYFINSLYKGKDEEDSA